MEDVLKRVREMAGEIYPDLVSIRRHLHQYPELSFNEVETANFISEKLRSFGIERQKRMAQTGIVSVIRGRTKGKCVALRADIDALPIQEQNEVPYKSKVDGRMHACGHDVHTTCLIGASVILNKLQDQLNGSVRLIFQPGEEKLPGGASKLIREGVLKDPSPAAIFGQHVHPPLETGKVGVKSGIYMASADEIYLTVKGKGGHAAMPEECIDPILIASNLIQTLQQVVSRHASPTIPTVLTFGKIWSVGGATNIIPGEVKIEGTFRTLDEDWRNTAHKLIETITSDVIKAQGATCDLNIVKGYPYLNNDGPLTDRFRDYAKDYLGSENVVELPVRMTAEDFAYYSHRLPSCFFRLGTGNIEQGITSPLHTPTFDVDERCLEIGAGLMAWVAVRELQS
jgi:amidohydrolase